MIALPYERIHELIEKEEYIRKLPIQKRRFVEAFCLSLNVEKTAKILKIPTSKCYKFLKDEQVQQAIRYQQELISLRNNITIDYFISELKKIIETSSTKTPDKLNALQLLARLTGHLKDKTDMTSQQMVVVKWDGLKSSEPQQSSHIFPFSELKPASDSDE